MGEAPEEGGDQDGGSTGERRVGEGQLELWHCAKRAYLRKVMQHVVPVGTKPHFKGPSSAAATAAAAAARPQQQSKTMNQGTLQIHHRLIFASRHRSPTEMSAVLRQLQTESLSHMHQSIVVCGNLEVATYDMSGTSAVCGWYCTTERRSLLRLGSRLTMPGACYRREF